jgi:nucleotide-binding universal stress UspA family protein
MVSIKQVLVPLDLGVHAPRVLEYSRAIADAFGASLRLLHVIGNPMCDGQLRYTLELEARARMSALLDAADRDRRGAAIDCVFGTPACEIARYAGDHETDLIVMGTHSHGPTFQMLTGSVAEVVTRLSPCPVLAVKVDSGPTNTIDCDPPAAVAAGP